MDEMFYYRLGKKRAGGGGGGGGSGGDNFPIGDGNTHIWISLAEGRTSPRLSVGVNGTVTVDWGDGSEPDTLTGTNVTVERKTPVHNYASAGEYVITLTGGSVGISGNNNRANLLADGASTSINDQQNVAYCSAVCKVECGENVTIGERPFYGMHSLNGIVLPSSIDNIGVTAFANCYSLGRLIVPTSVNEIGAMAFSNCCIAYYDFTKHTAVPTLSATTAFNSIPSDCEIRVPAALVDEWKAATNWSTYASYIVGV